MRLFWLWSRDTTVSWLEDENYKESYNQQNKKQNDLAIPSLFLVFLALSEEIQKKTSLISDMSVRRK